ncbi:hypothetical protein [Homoserinimonas sp. A520]
MSDPTRPRDNDEVANGTASPAAEEATAEREASASGEEETPVFDSVATEHPEVQDAAPDLVEPAPAAEPAVGATPEVDEKPVPLVEPATPQPTPVVRETAAPEQEAPLETTEAAGYDEHIDEPRTVEAQPVVAASRPQTIYVAAPVAPKAKGNRGFGLLFAFLGTLVFAVLLAAVIALIMLLVRPQNAFGGSILGFISSSAFWVPVAVFFVMFVMFALVVNRGSWVAWVLSSFLLAVAVYFLSIGIILLLEGLFGMTPTEANQAFSQLALSAPLIVAAILAREVTIWFGAPIASRGRKVKERNLEARAAYERELDNQPLGFS